MEPLGAPLIIGEIGESGDCELIVILPGGLGDVRRCAVGGSASAGGLALVTAAPYVGSAIDWSNCLGNGVLTAVE